MMQVNGYTETEFKETKIGMIPMDWDVISLRDLLRTTKRSLNPQDFPEETFEYYSIPAFQEFGHPILEGGNNIQSQKLVVDDGTVLFGKLNPRVPKVWMVAGISDHRKIASTEFIPLVPRDVSIAPQFLYFLAQSDYILTVSRGLVTGSTPSRQRVDTASFFEVVVPLPPLPEQQRIAAVLNAIQEEIAVQDDIIVDAKAFKRSLMQRLFTYGAGTEPAETKETEIGEIPAHWEMVELGDIAEIQSGGTPSRTRPEFYENGTIPWVKTLDLNNGIVMSTEEQITPEAFESVRGKIRPIGTVMVAMYGGAGTIGKSGLLAIEATTNQAVCCIEPNIQRFVPEYLHYFIIQLRPQWMKYAIGTRKDPNISKTIIENQHVPLPSLDEQIEIARQLSDVDEKIAVEEDRKAAMQDFFKTMLHQLMSGQIRLVGKES